MEAQDFSDFFENINPDAPEILSMPSYCDLLRDLQAHASILVCEAGDGAPFAAHELGISFSTSSKGTSSTQSSSPFR